MESRLRYRPAGLQRCAIIGLTLLAGAVMKTFDRGLSYSITRTSKELLYVPLSPARTYQVKAWLDMFGYRLFKAIGSVLILLMTQWLPGVSVHIDLSILTIGICGLWVAVVLRLARTPEDTRRPLPIAVPGSPAKPFAW